MGQLAPTGPDAPAEPLGSLRWPQRLASGRPTGPAPPPGAARFSTSAKVEAVFSNEPDQYSDEPLKLLG